MPTITKSHAKDGHAYFKHTGRYSEVTTKAKELVNNNAASATKQKNLAPKGNNSAAAMTFQSAYHELGWK